MGGRKSQSTRFGSVCGFPMQQVFLALAMVTKT